MAEALLFHPISQDMIVLAAQRNFSPTELDKNFVMRVFLHEYVKGIMKSHDFIDIPYLNHPNTSIDVKFDVRAIDDNGTYSPETHPTPCENLSNPWELSSQKPPEARYLVRLLS
jgi:hypothetical protein